MTDSEEKTIKLTEEEIEICANIKDKKGNIKKEILDKMVDESIDKNRLIYERLSEM